MYQITLKQVPNQYVSFNIGADGYDIQLRTVKGQLYADLYLNGNPLFYGRRCCNLMPLIQNQKVGNFYFKDLIGNEDPQYEKFNNRFILVYDSNYII